ncbi:hypothetical protein AYI69_g6934 [Smittium culicis]|uniref:Uncharacterized protein n=1 Tax=Smittium culicis TaxID=133412 RepID=A0A1R1XVK5_9FUNG|nr:hypothetical protein AYI69_g6934 [Smittium culicis]
MMSKLSSENGIKKTDPTIAPELDPRTENPTARTGEYDTPQHIYLHESYRNENTLQGSKSKYDNIITQH